MDAVKVRKVRSCRMHNSRRQARYFLANHSLHLHPKHITTPLLRSHDRPTMPIKIPFSSFLRPVPQLLLSLPILIFVNNHVVSIAKVSGPSMSPTLTMHSDTELPKKDWVLLEHWKAPVRAARGDIVSFMSPTDPWKLLIKRVVAVEGDLVKNKARGGVHEVPRGYVWVEGDGPKSRDSCEFGPIPRGLITARVKRIIWPLSRAGRIPDYQGWRSGIVMYREERRIRPLDEEW